MSINIVYLLLETARGPLKQRRGHNNRVPVSSYFKYRMKTIILISFNASVLLELDIGKIRVDEMEILLIELFAHGASEFVLNAAFKDQVDRLVKMVWIRAVAEFFVAVEAALDVHGDEIDEFFVEDLLQQAVIGAVGVELDRLHAGLPYEAQEVLQVLALQGRFAPGDDYGVGEPVGHGVPEAAVNFFRAEKAPGVHDTYIVAIGTAHIAARSKENRSAFMRIIAETGGLIAVNADL